MTPADNLELPTPDTATLVENRAAMLEHWESATGGKRSHLYSKRLSDPVIISKNQFYSWLRGDLPKRSTAARRLEAYLTKHSRSVAHDFLAP